MSPILLLVLLFTPQDKPPEKASLSGTVINAITGEPLNKTEVFAEPSEGHDSSAKASTTTDGKGNFTLVGLGPGKYRLMARRNGYLEAYYGSRANLKRGTPITLDAGQDLKDLRIKALPFGVIAGTVRDPDGEPVAHVDVAIYQWTYENGRRALSGEGGTGTDDLGQFRIIDVSPGKYYVRARPYTDHDLSAMDHSQKSNRPREFLIPTFYPGATDPSAASLVEVSAGARVTGTDIVLARSRLFRVAVQVETPAGLTGDTRMDYSMAGFGDVGNRVKTKEGIEFRGVPPGTWMLTAFAEEPPASTPGKIVWDFSKRTLEAHVPVQVGEADIEGLRIVVNGGADVTGHLKVEGENPASLEGNTVVFENGEANPNTSHIDAESTFHNRVSAGRYVVDLPGITGRNQLFIKSMEADGRDILRGGLTVAGPGKISIETVLSPDGGQVEGVVLDKDGQAASGATVVVVPGPGLPQRHDFFKEFTADQAGRFLFSGVAPGDYKLFAWEDVESGAWFDPAFMKDFEAKGEPVTVETKGHHNLKVQLIH